MSCKSRLSLIPTLMPAAHFDADFSADAGAKPLAEGISVSYWQKIVYELGVSYYLIPFPTIDPSLSALSQGSLDLVAGVITITSQRLKEFALSQPFASVSLTLLIPKTTRNLFSRIKPFIEWALAIFSIVGYGDIVPITRAGRIVMGLWMVLSLVIVASLTAGIPTTAAVAVSDRQPDLIHKKSDVNNRRVSTFGQQSATAQERVC